MTTLVHGGVTYRTIEDEFGQNAGYYAVDNYNNITGNVLSSLPSLSTPTPQVDPIQEAVKLINAYETWTPTYGQSAGDKESQFDAQAVNTATRLLNDYAVNGGDVSGFPSSVQKYTTPEYANFVASRGSGTLGTALPALMVAAGGLAGVGAFGGTAAAGATGTEAAGTYGAGGEFGAGATTYGGGAGTLSSAFTPAAAASSPIPELGMIADAGTAQTAVAQGIAPEMLAGGAGTLTLPGLEQTIAQTPVAQPTQVAQAPTGTMTDVSPGLQGSPVEPVVGLEQTVAAQTPPMPPAVPELATNNVVPGGVTATSGMDNAVTAGTLGTSGAIGATGGGMTPGVGEFGETGAGGWEGDIPGGPGVGTSYQFPYNDVIKGLLGAYFSSQQAKDLQDAITQAAGKADPFAAQRPQYQQQFSNLTTSPSSFFEDPAIRDIISTQQDYTGRKLASQGYNMSGNFAADLTKVGQREAFGQYLPYSRMIGEAAGAFQGTGGAGQVAGQGAIAGSGIQGQRDAGYGSILESIFRGQQPTGVQQSQGTPSNPGLMSYFLT